MHTFYILTENSSFRTKTDVTEIAKDEAAALRIGVRSAISIAGDEIMQGEKAATVEVSVQDGGGGEILRSTVTIALAPLIVRSKSE